MALNTVRAPANVSMGTADALTRAEAPGFDDIAHQLGEDVVCLGQILDLDLKKRPRLGVQGGRHPAGHGSLAALGQLLQEIETRYEGAEAAGVCLVAHGLLLLLVCTVASLLHGRRQGRQTAVTVDLPQLQGVNEAVGIAKEFKIKIFVFFKKLIIN